MMTTKPPLRSAEIIAVGSELLGSSRVDTNSLFLAERLASIGIVLVAKSVVGDDREYLGAIFAQALARADLVILTGGLGPTDDDRTREAVAGVLGLPLEEDPAITAQIERRFASRGLRMPEVNRRQAMVPRGARVLDNPLGSAPGLFIEAGDKAVALVPGPPSEMQPMIERLWTDVLAQRAGDERLYRAVLFVVGRGESHVEERVQPIYSQWLRETPPISTTILASPGMIELHLTIRSADPKGAKRRLAEAEGALAAVLGEDLFSTDGRTLELVVGDLLRERGLTIAAAESCTGGLLMSRLTDVPGSSAYVLGGVTAYSNDAKTVLADVPAAAMIAHGAVSEPVAAALAEGVRTRLGASLGVGITGIAGPGGGSDAKPVGTVAIAVSGFGPTIVRTIKVPGGRTQVKFWATQAALDMVRRALLSR